VEGHGSREESRLKNKTQKLYFHSAHYLCRYQSTRTLLFPHLEAVPVCKADNRNSGPLPEFNIKRPVHSLHCGEKGEG
jgi:hypothetical protein